jgi:hypothetical protein
VRGEVSVRGDYNYRGVPGRRATSEDWLNNYNLACSNSQRGVYPGEPTSKSTFGIETLCF